MCMCAGSSKKYLPKEEVVEVPDFRYIPEPQLSELVAYMRQRREHLVYHNTTADVRAEIIRNVTEHTQPVDQYPRGRQFLNDEEYMSILRDLLNLSNILDDMEQTGIVSYTNRTQYYALYSKLYRMLIAKAKQ
ncbi:hypothetical protein VaNZ11_014969 [Volvox africanus]|uniref:Uncharacterized protein n=1 Tax=Volvox africanus TaxID=51714 RepID=A0ABQ5SJI9_9CHLO|nr:hypothetical protein VaNZ11_014969 [Volvox africanus]